MFGFIRKLREKDEEIEKLREEKRNILQREARTIDAYYGAKEFEKKAIAEAAEWKDKYYDRSEKYLNLLERYEKALTAKDINVPTKGVE